MSDQTPRQDRRTSRRKETVKDDGSAQHIMNILCVVGLLLFLPVLFYDPAIVLEPLEDHNPPPQVTQAFFPPAPTLVPNEDGSLVIVPNPTDPPEVERVWVSRSGNGTRYHSRPDCGTMKNPVKISLIQAQCMGYTPCKRCYKNDK